MKFVDFSATNHFNVSSQPRGSASTPSKLRHKLLPPLFTTTARAMAAYRVLLSDPALVLQGRLTLKAPIRQANHLVDELGTTPSGVTTSTLR